MKRRAASGTAAPFGWCAASGWWTAAGAALVTLAGCGGGGPLLHPAHTLPEGVVSFAAGSSGRMTLGGLSRAEDDLKRAGSTPGGANTEQERRGVASGALSRFAVAPGVAPFVAGRAGLGGHNEAGLTYTGRTFRVDGRHAFEWRNVALSLGLGGSGVLSHAGDKPPRDVVMAGPGGLKSATLASLRGYGLELPVVFGYRSSADVVLLWAGVRAGFERSTFDLSLTQTPGDVFGSSGDVTRLWAGGLLGFGIGLQPIQVRVELDAAYESVHGNLVTGQGELAGEVAGWSLTPAAAISAKF